MKRLSNIIGETYRPKNGDEQRFVDKHVVQLFQNMYSDGKYDALFKGTSVRPIDRPKERHGYNPGDDEKYYESALERGDLIVESYGMKNLLDGAVAYCKRSKSKDKPGHVMQAVVDAANKHNIHLYRAQMATRVSRHPEEKSSVDDAIKDAGKIRDTFSKYLAINKKNKRTFNPDSHDTLDESFMSLCVNSDDVVLSESYHAKDSMDAINKTADELALPPAYISALHIMNANGYDTHTLSDEHVRRTYEKHAGDAKFDREERIADSLRKKRMKMSESGCASVSSKKIIKKRGAYGDDKMARRTALKEVISDFIARDRAEAGK